MNRFSLTSKAVLTPWLFLVSGHLYALAAAPQNTPSEGFTLFAPLGNDTTYLMDNGLNLVHSWPSSHTPGNAVYLLENGNLLRTIKTGGIIGGSGGGVQEIAWDGTLLWDFRYDTGGVRLHHDVEVMPNGNILMVAWENFSRQEAIDQGRDPGLINGNVFSPDHIIEVQVSGPTSGTIVWEWHAWDHLIQDFDLTKANYGVVADHPELIDINFPPRVINNGDWMHVNSIDYNPKLDQIILSVHGLNEIWVIDHSTTTQEAAGHTGGDRGKGGDLLYRWGNPQAYGAGTPSDQQLFGQHDANWIDPEFPGGDNILIFNNGVQRPGGPFSSVDEIEPPVDASGNYTLVPGSAYGPAAPVWSYTAANPGDFYSSFISGAQRLPNGNTLICSGAQGWLFEVTAAQNLIWEYHNNLPNQFQNTIFKVRRYQHYLWPNRETLSAATGGVVDFALEAGSSRANRSYLLVASMSGTFPGTPLPGGLETIPLNQDQLTDYVLANLSNPVFSNFSSSLDATGAATAQLNTFGPLNSSMIGQTVHFAFALSGPWDFASNAMAVEILP